MDKHSTPVAAEPAPGKDAPKHRPNYFWAAVILGAILTLIAYLSNPYHFEALFAVFLTVSIMVLTASQPKAFPSNCIAIFIIGVLLVIAMPNVHPIQGMAKNAEVKQNLHSIQLALERYAEQHTCYPNNIATLLADPSAKMDASPANPFNGPYKRPQPGLLNEDPTVIQPLNEIDNPYLDLEGQFCYLPEQEIIDGQLVSTGYKLIAFGAVSQSWLAQRVNIRPGAKVILMLEGGEGFEEKRAIERSMDSAAEPTGTGTDRTILGIPRLHRLSDQSLSPPLYSPGGGKGLQYRARLAPQITFAIPAGGALWPRLCRSAPCAMTPPRPAPS
jgi:hypothetical protein